MLPTWETLLIASVSAAHGAHGATHSLNVTEIVGVFLNALLFFGFLFYVLRPKTKAGLIARRAHMEKAIQEAKEKQTQAEAKLAEFTKRLADLEGEVAQVVASYQKEAEAEEARIAEETGRALDRLRRESDFAVHQAVRKAEKTIRDAAIEATIRLTEQSLQNQLSKDEHSQIAERYIRDLEMPSSTQAARKGS